MKFTDLGLSAKVLSAVEGAGYTEPTPIQEQAIPHVLQKRDVMGIAQTGTGKTASFVLPMLSLIEKGRARNMPRVIIGAPVRSIFQEGWHPSPVEDTHLWRIDVCFHPIGGHEWALGHDLGFRPVGYWQVF